MTARFSLMYEKARSPDRAYRTPALMAGKGHMLKQFSRRLLSCTVAASLPLILAACSGSSSSAPAPAANADGHAPFTMGIIHVG